MFYTIHDVMSTVTGLVFYRKRSPFLATPHSNRSVDCLNCASLINACNDYQAPVFETLKVFFCRGDGHHFSPASNVYVVILFSYV